MLQDMSTTAENDHHANDEQEVTTAPGNGNAEQLMDISRNTAKTTEFEGICEKDRSIHYQILTLSLFKFNHSGGNPRAPDMDVYLDGSLMHGMRFLTKRSRRPSRTAVSQPQTKSANIGTFWRYA
ncbi:hypothetical protein DdX_15958 [Ditylenchus destructor]|uniref:Uncharacterized protein n=1 Tax=Ditylenchus destructor TaxID=166010 RepID=A0AAD4R0C1_9BILA|nr:hypothetical protein DdX_15958 [Ditylenchus destructor]